MQTIKKILEKINIPCDHPDFFYRVCAEVLPKVTKEMGVVEKIVVEDALLAMTPLTSALQESVQIRNTIRSRKIATYLIQDRPSVLDQERVKEAIGCIENRGYILTQEHKGDAPAMAHLLKMLRFLYTSEEANKLFKSITRPFQNSRAEQLIRETLDLHPSHAISDSDCKRAILSALICYFRQNVGSCFATAPAIIIQGEQPLLFLKDMADLLNTSRLKRTFSGVELVVPMSPSYGSATLRRPVFVDRLALPITMSHGFLLALERAKIIDATLLLEQKREKIKELMQRAFPQFKGGFITCETLLKEMLLSHFSLKEEDLFVFEERPKSLLQQQLFFEMAGPRKDKSQAVQAYITAFNQAKATFKIQTENPMLRTWEFTIASFAESKANFTTWNLYSSLGLNKDEVGGIGKCLFDKLSHLLEEIQREAQELQSQYERSFLEAKALEGQFRSVEQDSKANWIRASYTAKLQEIDALLEKRDEAIYKSKKISALFAKLLDFYISKFPVYFQEIYDAEMFFEHEDIFDDTPAGFRLLFKHGRENPAAWTLIYTQEEFVLSLVRFFTMTEYEIRSNDAFAFLEKEVSQAVDAIIAHVRSQEFIESALKRAGRGSQNSKKPWAYVSGGSMHSLVSALYCREDPPTTQEKWVESELELLAFYTDTLRQLPANSASAYIKDPTHSMLAYSPTHAFVFKPGSEPFVQSWNEEAYPYTWIRDNFVLPRKAFIHKQFLNFRMMEKVADLLSWHFEGTLGHLIKRSVEALPIDLTPSQFRIALINQLMSEPWVKSIGRSPLSLEEIDAAFYELLPLFTSDRLFERTQILLKHILGEHIEITNALQEYLERVENQYTLLSPQDLAKVVKASIVLLKEDLFYSQDMHLEVAIAMQAHQFAMPRPIFVADSNWSNQYFGFVVSPTTEELELWRLDYTGMQGRPLLGWKKWLNGYERKAWGLFIRPFEYDQ